ncbi:kinesin-like protein KIFC3 [Tripterygium wilfordii]|uniref:Kinesin-like protein KIFC3 n=1 Tax=Tripterygium wilfordii TaxID=458696 RepID=A0A7J7D227_TRIWF|nr:kinesin-like protein KIFC3 [Tripterygium wilfordii]
MMILVFATEFVDEGGHSMDGDNVWNRNEVEETTHSMDDDSILNRNSLAQGPTLPELQKIISLSSKIQNLKKEHAILSDQATYIFPGPEVDAISMLLHLSGEHELLKKRYLEESFERKRLYNEIIELKGNIRVFCRCRPVNEVEISNGLEEVVEFDSSQDNELQIISSDSSKKQFKFDHVFKPDDDQDAVFVQTKPIVTSLLDGYNVCIFAYGQTGTGKTFTMEGTPENRGVNYKTLEELFRISGERNAIIRYELSVSMLEVYNEEIKDLLVENLSKTSTKLEIKQAADGILEVPGLVEAHVRSTEEVWELLNSGSREGSVGSTCANELSSRSHCQLRITVLGHDLVNRLKTKSHLWLVDLASSERVEKVDVEGERLEESQFINKSLSALGDVISALVSKTGPIPYRSISLFSPLSLAYTLFFILYSPVIIGLEFSLFAECTRNSNLTLLLQSSLGGDCKTLMFVQIGPSSRDLGEILCSLNFASRVRGIESADPQPSLSSSSDTNKGKHAVSCCDPQPFPSSSSEPKERTCYSI